MENAYNTILGKERVKKEDLQQQEWVRLRGKYPTTIGMERVKTEDLQQQE
jgi:hypothetical protein